MTLQLIKSTFTKLFKNEPLVVKSPGRINLIGEHTDYNDGFVLPAAINKNIYFAIQRNNLNRIRIFAADLNEEIDISSHNIERSKTAWANYLIGSYAEMINDGYSLRGFDCVFGGDLPNGAGLSSSAAIECGTIFGLSKLYDVEIPMLKIAQLGQRAEHNYAGVQCGIMDQYAVAHGKIDHVIQLDCRALTSEYSPAGFEGYTLLLVNSNVKHSLASSEYNTRRIECKTGVEVLKKHYPEIKNLRDVCLEQINEHKNELDATVLKRCQYVMEENNRVLQFCEALENKNYRLIGDLLRESHLGLKEKYQVSCSELDLLFDIAEDLDCVLGARMMGGGFGGCTINIVENDQVKEVKQKFHDIYTSKTGINPDFYEVEITNGLEIIDN